MKSNLNIHGLHKSGTILQEKIYNYINDKLGYDCILFCRIPIRHLRWYESNIGIPNLDYLTVRHPLNKLISQYYSFGWTHEVREGDTYQIKKRNKIRGLSLVDYILDPHFAKETRRIYRIAFDPVHTGKLIKYEDIMSNPQNFLRLILSRVNAEYLFDDIWLALGDEFNFTGKDLSDDIINNNLITHRRNLDHNEYKQKLPADIMTKLDPDVAELVRRYEKNIEHFISLT